MNEIHWKFLYILKCALKGEKPKGTERYSFSEWQELYELARIHLVLPLFAQVTYENTDAQMRAAVVEEAVALTVKQASASAEFIQFYRFLLKKGLRPLVMKGMICRNLYPVPEQRASADEDLLIEPRDIDLYDAAFREYGLLPENDPDIHKEHEITYKGISMKLCIELHRLPFPPDSSYGKLNALFADRSDATSEKIYDTEIFALNPTQHLLYMLCHIYKHFLYSGVGIRQLCDIARFTDHYRDRIEWQNIMQACKEYKMDLFTAGVLKICRDYLGMEFMPEEFENIKVDEVPMLEDILTGGLYGASDMDRLHSSTMTIAAVTAEEEGKKQTGLMKSLFPSIGSLKGRFTYLEDKPWLLPYAWGQRIRRYMKERKTRNVDPSRSIEIGKRRIELLRKYGIIE